MNKNILENDMYKGVKLILIFFVGFTLLSYLYVLFTGTYNGDFIDQKPKLSQLNLFISFIYTILPFLILFFIYSFFRKARNSYSIDVPKKLFGEFLIFIAIFQIITTSIFNVGMLTKEIYQAPFCIKIFIQIFNRFNLTFGVFLYIIVSKRKISLFQYFLLTLCIVISFQRASLMVFVLIMFFLLLIKYKQILILFKKKFIYIILVLIISPFLVASLYDFRDSIRKEEDISQAKEMSTSKLIFGKLVGRLSSYPSTTILMERESIVKKISKEEDISSIQYLKEAISVFYGKVLDLNKLQYKGFILATSGVRTNYFSMMAGTQGSLMIASYSSNLAFFVTLITILGIVVMTFFLGTFFHYKGIDEFLFLLFCIPAMSGVAGEFMEVFMYLFLYTILFLIANSLVKLTHKEIES